jgi:predicted nucleic acid-binding protein
LRTYFDSSVLIAAFVEEEERHERAVDALLKPGGFTSTHALGEVYGTLTGGRLPIQLTPAEAIALIEENVLSRLEMLELSLPDYRSALKSAKSVGARGGAIYDVLHLQAARRGEAKRILTVNVRHFQAFGPDLKEMIAEP